MRPLRYSINVTLDGCADHRAVAADEELHEYTTELPARADALIFGRTTYELMESGWRLPSEGALPEPVESFARRINAMPKYVVSSTLESVDWNAELLDGDDLDGAVRRLKDEPGEGLYVGGITLPTALAGLGLIDEYEFVVHPRIAGYGPRPFAGLADHVDLALVSRGDLRSGAVALRYEPR